MQIKTISISGLLGSRDIQLNYSNSNAFVAIHGPNGVGKTHIMKIVNSLLSLSWAEMVSIPFSLAEIEFDNGDRLVATRTPDETGDSEISQIYGVLLVVKYYPEGRGAETWDLSGGRPSFRVSPTTRRQIEQETGYTAQMSRAWTSPDGTEKISLSKLLARYPELRWQVDLPLVDPLPPGDEASANLGPGVVQFVDTHRLIHEMQVRRSSISEAHSEPAVRDRAAKMKTNLARWSGEYMARSTSLDATFASRVLEKSYVPFTDEILLSRHDELMSKRAQLIDLGMLAGDNSSRLIKREMNDTERSLVHEFLQDLESKMSILDHPFKRVATLLKTVNADFIEKEVRLDSKRGLVVVASSGETLDVAALSSGEQHYLVMLYDIVFGQDSASFILLDEPEISLHPQWQRGFLDVLISAHEERGVKFLVATHSPMVLGRHVDRAVFIGPREKI
ncbi:AAA family ATPase [Kocuria rosea]|uniref:AAA family ATPase n=1 Tax=Kocuria rosea TaxID=1275 RepID=UPI000F713253|nr:AAA family ATPase [Kocuria rosea]VEI51277.1 cytochrome c biogenesis protein CcmA [Kocuria rosea]